MNGGMIKTKNLRLKKSNRPEVRRSKTPKHLSEDILNEVGNELDAESQSEVESRTKIGKSFANWSRRK